MSFKFLESPDFNDAVIGAVLGNQTSHNKMADYFFGDGKGPVELIHMIGALLQLHAQDKASQ